MIYHLSLPITLKGQRQENECNSNLHDSQDSTQANLNDTVFTVKALSDKTASDPNSSPAFVSKVNNFLDRSIEGVNEVLINGYRNSIAPSSGSQKQTTNNTECNSTG